jgi:hypothetical protein
MSPTLNLQSARSPLDEDNDAGYEKDHLKRRKLAHNLRNSPRESTLSRETPPEGLVSTLCAVATIPARACSVKTRDSSLRRERGALPSIIRWCEEPVTKLLVRRGQSLAPTRMPRLSRACSAPSAEETERETGLPERSVEPAGPLTERLYPPGAAAVGTGDGTGVGPGPSGSGLLRR